MLDAINQAQHNNTVSWCCLDASERAAVQCMHAYLLSCVCPSFLISLFPCPSQALSQLDDYFVVGTSSDQDLLKVQQLAIVTMVMSVDSGDNADKG